MSSHPVTTTFRRARALLRDTAGAIDLASIMVGVLVIGIVGGVIAATVFAVVPWSQDKAAKQDLTAVQTAESVQYALGADSGASAYTPMAQLVKDKRIQPSKTVDVVTDAEGTCYVAASLSPTGKQFWTDSLTGPTISEYTTSSVSACAQIPALAPPVGAPGGDGGAPVAVKASAIPISFDRSNGSISYDQSAAAIEPADEPFKTGASCIITGEFPEGDWSVVSPREITSMTFWIGDDEYTVDPKGSTVDSHDVTFISTPSYDHAEIALGLTNVDIGDNSDATVHNFFKNSYIAYTLDGCADTNYFHVQTSDEMNPVPAPDGNSDPDQPSEPTTPVSNPWVGPVGEITESAVTATCFSGATQTVDAETMTRSSRGVLGGPVGPGGYSKVSANSQSIANGDAVDLRFSNNYGHLSRTDGPARISFTSALPSDEGYSASCYENWMVDEQMYRAGDKPAMVDYTAATGPEGSVAWSSVTLTWQAAPVDANLTIETRIGSRADTSKPSQLVFDGVTGRVSVAKFTPGTQPGQDVYCYGGDDDCRTENGDTHYSFADVDSMFGTLADYEDGARITGYVAR
jgi:hypothetical protein